MSNQASLGDISSSGSSESKESQEETLEEEKEAGFVDIPEDWSVETVKEAADPGQEDAFTDGDWVESSDMDEEGNIQLVQLGHLGEGTFKGEPDRFVNEEFAEEEDCTILEEGELMISRMQEPILRSCLLPEFDKESIMAVDIARLRPKEEWNKQFLKYLFNSRPVWKQGLAWASGTTRKRISRSNLGKVELQKPEEDEQRRIASVLYNVDQAISKTEEIIEQTQRVKKGLMQDLLVGEGYGEEKKRIQIGPEEFEIPENWKKKELEELIDIQSGDYFKKKNFVEDGVRCLKIDNVGYGRIFWDSETRLPESYLEEHEDLVLEEGDLLMAMNRPITQNEVKVGLVEEKDTPSILYQRVGRFHTDEKTDNRFLKFALRGFIFKKELKRRLSGTNQPYVNNGDIYSIEIPLPPLETQEEIAEKLGHLDRKIELHREEKEQLQRLKKGLMQDLLTGSVRTGEDVRVLDEVVEVEG